jgi:hypothetical protein
MDLYLLGDQDTENTLILPYIFKEDRGQPQKLWSNVNSHQTTLRKVHLKTRNNRKIWKDSLQNSKIFHSNLSHTQSP